jgi:hypothetical protein
MKAAIQNGLLTLGSTLNDTPPFCASENCTFPLYRSLAVCTRWENVTSHLTFSTYENTSSNTTTGRWSLTNNSYIETVGPGDLCVLNMSSAAKPQLVINNADVPNSLDFRDTIAFGDNRYPIADFFVLYINRSVPSITYNYNAVEFVLEWCVQEYNTSVVNSTVYTAKEDSTHNFTGGHSELTGPIFNTTLQFGDQLSYDTDNQTHFILSNYLRKILNGSVYQIESDFYKTSDAAESLFQRINTDSENFVLLGEDKGLSAMITVLQNIATSMTNT